MARIAEIEEISYFDNLMTRAMEEIDDVEELNDWEDPRKRQLLDLFKEKKNSKSIPLVLVLVLIAKSVLFAGFYCNQQ